MGSVEYDAEEGGCDHMAHSMPDHTTAKGLILILTFSILVISAVTAQATVQSEPQTYTLGERILTLGSWGADVFELQLQLNQAGYNVLSDGLYGRETQRAILSLQVASGIEPDGIVGAATLAALRSQYGTIEYVVEPGDSLWTIARRFDTTMDEIFVLNRLTTSVLRIGQSLQVPAPPTYVIQPGDTLSEVAARFKTTVQEIVTLNNISNPDRVRVGMEIRLPRSSR